MKTALLLSALAVPILAIHVILPETALFSKTQAIQGPTTLLTTTAATATNDVHIATIARKISPDGEVKIHNGPGPKVPLSFNSLNRHLLACKRDETNENENENEHHERGNIETHGAAQYDQEQLAEEPDDGEHDKAEHELAAFLRQHADQINLVFDVGTRPWDTRERRADAGLEASDEENESSPLNKRDDVTLASLVGRSLSGDWPVVTKWFHGNGKKKHHHSKDKGKDKNKDKDMDKDEDEDKDKDKDKHKHHTRDEHDGDNHEEMDHDEHDHSNESIFDFFRRHRRHRHSPKPHLFNPIEGAITHIERRAFTNLAIVCAANTLIVERQLIANPKILQKDYERCVKEFKKDCRKDPRLMDRVGHVDFAKIQFHLSKKVAKLMKKYGKHMHLGFDE